MAAVIAFPVSAYEVPSTYALNGMIVACSIQPGTENGIIANAPKLTAKTPYAFTDIQITNQFWSYYKAYDCTGVWMDITFSAGGATRFRVLSNDSTIYAEDFNGRTSVSKRIFIPDILGIEPTMNCKVKLLKGDETRLLQARVWKI